MIEKNLIKEYAEAFLEPLPELFLTDVTVLPGNIITVEIAGDKGVNIDDCVTLSKYLESKLNRDQEDFELTVTSAGLTSPFKTLRQYKNHIDKEVELITKKGEKFRGTLKDANEDGFTVTITRKEIPVGGKRKKEVLYDLTFAYNEVKQTIYNISFK
ncbi:MAG: ribosome assembly cofactor RimP [Dysgonamonadaceae bacterium]|jgi:ribosome maturation factor RimP|nr:ribosome assembly cofactor RimP [Dysgonamonadaceae bacterium]MDD3308818.1 ribosome assembly cofactor RimP [Dysgonamonadaceae bacterium]MDD3901199.1 ribosome assembly cofactor RimP [Dysgonamonadaceae bacterium]MDD4398961.1 ribosome assembly cofactor RimP [Dysgonamonadaceae bacterium]MEA5080504.1 ribosome assembly cofactor RimP [Dysgonamonadaceae bacterium]